MIKKPVQKRLFHLMTLSLIIILMGGGLALLYQWHQSPTPGHANANDDSVVGPPSLSASFIDATFKRLGSPMAGTGQAIEDASRAANIDDAFALGVWWTETNDGAAGVGSADNNPGSVRGSVGYPSAYDGYTIYPSYTAAVNYWFSMMKIMYVDRGLTTVYAISHPYVGTSTSDLWAGKVVALMDNYRAEAPPIPTPTPTISPDMQRVTKTFQQQNAFNPVVSEKPSAPQMISEVTDTSKLSGKALFLLVIFDLLLALILALWAWNMNRRSASKTQIAILSSGSLQEKIYAGLQQPAALFATISGTLRTTEDLQIDGISPAFLGATNPQLPNYTSSEALFSLDAFMSSQIQQSAQLTPTWPAMSPGLAQMAKGQFARPAGMGLSNRSDNTYAPTTAGPLRRTRLQPSQSAENQYASPWPTADQNWPTPGDWAQAQSFSANSNNEQPATNDANTRQPALVAPGAGSGRSNGLLSRYRETQTQDLSGRSL